MTVFNPLHDPSALETRLATCPGQVVACYCAQWCDTCRKYYDSFTDLASRNPERTFIWIDIEESPELLGDIDVENFPTIAVQDASHTLFFGALPPHIGHLERLIRRADRPIDPARAAPPLLRQSMAASRASNA
ncbi:MAG: thioredoxin [Candidimonas sp.]|nr:MAG: thioredoxin [Candidimonas sp.]